MSFATSQSTRAETSPQRVFGLSSAQLVGLAVLTALLISAISLAFSHAIDYDPDGWIVYARELFGPGALNTSGYPAWKPLPSLLVGPFTWISRSGADVYYWLLITRAMGVLAVFGVAAIASRYAGRWAGLIAAATLMLSPWWFVDSTLGRDGPTAAALTAAAVLAYQRRWHRPALLCGALVSLLRPEAGPFVVVLGLWLWRRRKLTIWELGATVVVLGGLWELPVLLHAGRSPASISAGGGVAGTASRASIPFLAVIVDGARELRQLPTAVLIIGIVATAWGWAKPAQRFRWLQSLWGRSAEERVLIVGAICWVLEVAVETQYGFAGNPRYLVSALVLFSVIVGVVAVRIAGASPALRAAATAIVVLGTIPFAVGPLRVDHKLIAERTYQVKAIQAELRELRCPGYVWANRANNAYLAEITGQSMAATLLPKGHPQRFVDGRYWFVYCAPASWKPPAKAT